MTSKAGFSKSIHLTALVLVGVLTGCGGGGGDGSTTSNTTTISGSIVAAPVNGASVVITDTGGNALAGPVNTGTDGRYSVSIDNAHLGSDLVFAASGGTFADEASGATTTAGALSACVAAGSLSAGASVHLTPASSIVCELVNSHGMTHAAAQTTVNTAFGFDADTTTAPADATNPAPGATQAELLAGLRAAAFSQLTQNLGLAPAEQFALLAALAQDIAHGDFNGADAGGAIAVGAITLPVDIQNRFTRALVDFHGGANDQTGLTNSQLGSLMFAKLVLTNTYQIEYLPGMMDAMQGKTMFNLRITRRDNGDPVSGLTVNLMPMMYMDGHMHSTPFEACTESTTVGTYTCTMYYLMASSMMGGISMGYWELMVMAGMGESATFYPQVMMAMGDTTRATLKGQTDMIAGMMMGTEEQRSYYLFRDSLSGSTGNHSFGVFVAAKESMMSYPAVSVGTTLSAGTAYELTATSMSVEMSTDGMSWTAASDNGNGHWSASGLTGLIDGVAGSIYVRVSINGEQKTTDGMTAAGDGTNDYAVFSVTP